MVVALEAVRNIELGEITVSTQLVNPLDLDGIMKLLGAKQPK